MLINAWIRKKSGIPIILFDLATQFLLASLIGLQQLGKTALCQAIFPDHVYANLEWIDVSHAVAIVSGCC